MPSLAWLGMTAALLLSSGCAVTIHDATYCAPIPGDLGSVCDNFLTANQKILSEAEWVTLQSQWMRAGKAVECTTSDTVGDIKAELEQLCSKTACDYATLQATETVLDKIQATGQAAKQRGNP